MRFALAMLVVVAVLAATPVSAATKSFALETTFQDGGFVFLTANTTTANPTLEVDPEDMVTVNLTNTDPDGNVAPHNFVVRDVDGSAVPSSGYLTAQNASAEGTFTIPATAGATYTYECQVHPTTMMGTVQVSGSADTGNGTPGFAPLAALAALGAVGVLLRRRA